MRVISPPAKSRWRGEETAAAPAPVAATGHLRPVGLSTSYRSRCHRREVAYPDQVVRSQGKGEDPVDSGETSVPGLAHHPDRLQPSEDLFDSLALSLAHLIARTLGRPTVDDAVPNLLGNVR